MKFLRLLQDIPRLLELRLNEFIQDMHQPERINKQLVCLQCQTQAPCKPWMDAAERMQQLQTLTEP